MSNFDNNRGHDPIVNLVRELQKFGANVIVHDPLASPEEVEEEYGINLSNFEDACGSDSVVLAVPHADYLRNGCAWTTVHRVLNKSKGLVADLPAILDRDNIPEGLRLWRL